MSERSDSGITRRDIFRLTVVSGAAAAGAACSTIVPPPPRRRRDYVEKRVGTVCGACPAGCGISVRLADGNAVHIEGLPGHPESVLQAAEELTSEKIYCAGVAGDALALEVFRRMGTYLGVGFASLINLLNPEMIVIGGGVVNGWNLFEKQMIHEVDARAFPIPAAQVKIVAAECGDDAGLLGAAHLAFSANCCLSENA